MRTRGAGKNVSYRIASLSFRSNFFTSNELALKDLQVTTFTSAALLFLRELLSSLIMNVKCWRFTAILSHYKHLEKTKENSEDYCLLRCDALQSINFMIYSGICLDFCIPFSFFLSFFIFLIYFFLPFYLAFSAYFFRAICGLVSMSNFLAWSNSQIQPNLFPLC